MSRRAADAAAASPLWPEDGGHEPGRRLGVAALAGDPGRGGEQAEFLVVAQGQGGDAGTCRISLQVRADQTVQVVNVKPAARLADPAVAEALAWPGPLFEARGWDHEIWADASPVLLANVRFLPAAAGREYRPMTQPPRSWARSGPASAWAACWTGWSGPGRALLPRPRSCGCCGRGG